VTDTVGLSSTDANAVLPVNTALVAGTGTLSVTLRTAGNRTVTATDVSDGTKTANTSPAVAVAPAAAASFAVAGFPGTTVAGMTQAFTVTALDAFGNVASAYTGTAAFTSSDPLFALADYTFLPGDAGVRSFSTALKTSGTQSITATDGPRTGSQTGISVVPSGASTLTVAGYPATSTAGVANNFTVTARDAFGNVATGYVGTIAFTSSDANAAVPTSYTFTFSDNGARNFSATLRTVSTQSLTAVDQAASTITGTQTGISVQPAQAATLSVSGFPSPIVAGTSATLNVTARDAFGNTATGYTGTVTSAAPMRRRLCPRITPSSPAIPDSKVSLSH
jgi:large repetitive protein